MENQKKTLLTRDIVARDMRKLNEERIHGDVSFLLLGLLASPIFVGLVYLICSMQELVWLKVIFLVMIVAPLVFPLLNEIFSLFKDFRDRKRIARGEFDIVKRGLAYKSEEYRTRYGSRGGHLEHYMHFKGFKKYASRADYASAGDVYYIVHYKNNDKIELLYAADKYECECVSK